MTRRIGMVVGELRDAKRVGSERRYTELIRGLRERGDEIHLFAHRWDRAAVHGLQCHAVSAPGPASLRPLAFTVGALLTLRRWRGRLDLVHSHTKSLGEDIVSPGGSAHRAYLATLRRGDPGLRGRARSWHPFHRTTLAVEALQFRAARRIVVNSEWSRRQLAAAYPQAAPRVDVVYNGVDATHFAPAVMAGLRKPTRDELGLSDREIVFLFVGAGDRRKGLHELLAAFRHLTSAAVRLLVVGHRDRKETARVDTTLGDTGLEPRVMLRPFTADPRPYYAAADVFVLPTWFDPFSNATLEALACGLPVVTTSSNGVAELMMSGREGTIVGAGDAGALRAALGAMLDADRRSMSEAARTLAERMTWRRHVDAMSAIYDRLSHDRR
jgi:UDP-glucose:(heptosyl)LPS alpha-1,3-glucosyltransferase